VFWRLKASMIKCYFLYFIRLKYIFSRLEVIQVSNSAAVINRVITVPTSNYGLMDAGEMILSI
jgi:hypothetical protein